MGVHPEEQYLTLLRKLLTQPHTRPDRTHTGTKSLFGYQMRFDLQRGFPLLTTKKVAFRVVVAELLWFISGDTNIRALLEQNVHIWTAWPYQRYCYEQPTATLLSMNAFEQQILTDVDFAHQWGDLGPIYGKQWRCFEGIDQLANVITNLKKNPFSRRHVISTWNVKQLSSMLLPPCHVLTQFYVSTDRKLSCQLYQRSGDVFLGVPFNIASYALLTCLIAQVCGFGLGDLVYTLGDVHLYQNHLTPAKQQLTRTPYPWPKLVLNRNITSLFAFKITDIQLKNYRSHPKISAPVAV